MLRAIFPEKSGSVSRVLIFSLGSLGDTLVALPCFHQIAKRFPDAQRYLLSNFPVHSKAAAAYTVLMGSGLIDGHIPYPPAMRQLVDLFGLYRRLREWKPDLIVYLAPRIHLRDVVRDAIFFRLCGIRKIIGAPFSRDARKHRWDKNKKMYEPEACRLARNISSLGTIDLLDVANWDLRVDEIERRHALRLLEPIAGRPLIACSVGTKVQAKDWGADNWKYVLEELANNLPDYGLVLVGAEEERSLSDRIASDWESRYVNLCGVTSPRESAAVLSHARVFLGHDSGPMHLAATVQTRCVAVFSARNRPAVWFPWGTQHQIFYHKTNCWGCGLDTCIKEQKKCLTAITPNAVTEAVLHLLLNEATLLQMR